MTVDELRKIYDDAFTPIVTSATCADSEFANVIAEAERAGVTAIVRALRDEFYYNMQPHTVFFTAGKVALMFNEILGDAGEKVAGVAALEAAGAGLSPASGQTPATDPAPAVCEFRGEPGWYIRSCNGTLSVYDKPFPPEACAFCKMPIKFTEAKT